MRHIIKNNEYWALTPGGTVYKLPLYLSIADFEALSNTQTDTESLDFPINPERVAPLLRRLITPTKTRARIYDRDGSLILDSRFLYSRGQVLRFDLPPVKPTAPSVVEQAQHAASRAVMRGVTRLLAR